MYFEHPVSVSHVLLLKSNSNRNEINVKTHQMKPCGLKCRKEKFMIRIWFSDVYDRFLLAKLIYLVFDDYSDELIFGMYDRTIVFQRKEASIFSVCQHLANEKWIQRWFSKSCDINTLGHLVSHGKVKEGINKKNCKEKNVLFRKSIKKQPAEVFYKKKCSQKIRKIHRKTSVSEPQACNFFIKRQRGRLWILRNF